MGRPTKKEIWKRNIGYGVTKLTESVVQKLGEAFAIGATVPEACDYADVSPRTFYNWQEKNPKLLQYFSRMREKLPLKAKYNIAKRIHGEMVPGDILLSKWLVERQQPEAYAETLKIKGEVSSQDENKAIIDEFHSKLKSNIQKRSLEKAKQEGEL